MLIWGVFSFGMFVATLKKAPRLLSILFMGVVILFFLLTLHFFLDSELASKIAGVEGIITGLLAIYIAFAELLNPTFGRTILPIFPQKQ